jgi:tRNA(fMet)-specific endonuclease VapC
MQTILDRTAAIASAQVRRDLVSKGIELADALIAGQAIAGGFTLVSNNTRHFAHVKGLHLVNWAV